MTTITRARTLDDCKYLLRKREPFNHNSMKAIVAWKYTGNVGRMTSEMEIEHLRSIENAYIVFSYATPIAWVDLDTGKSFFSDTYHSQTTSRHQNIAISTLG